MTTIDDRIPTVNWPKASGTYKFVQLDVNGNPFLQFAETESDTVSGHPSHPFILRVFLTARGIPFEIITSRNPFSGYDYPATQGERYKVLGMGQAEVNVENHSAMLRGGSRTYNLGLNSEHLQKIREIEAWDIREQLD